MTNFTVSLAGLVIEVSALYPATEEFFKDYIYEAASEPAGTAESEPAFGVAVSPDDIDFERRQSALQDEADGIPIRPFSAPYLETLAVLRHIANRLPDHNAVLVHGTVLAYHGRAYMLTAPSGTGKTTHARLWLDLLPDAYVLNGDKPFLKVADDGIVYACGTPWQGKEGYGCNEILPLDGICLLEQSQENHIEAVSLSDALAGLMRQLYRPEGDLLRSIQLLGSIGEGVRLWRMGCNMDPEAAVVSSGAMLRPDSGPCSGGASHPNTMLRPNERCSGETFEEDPS